MKKKGRSEKFTIRVESRFEAAHNLREYYGRPEPLHGHSWKVVLRVESGRLDKEDISIDYVKVKQALDALTKRLDYTYVNEVPPFDKINPSSENIARWFYENLDRKELLGQCRIADVTLWEGPFNALTYRRPED